MIDMKKNKIFIHLGMQKTASTSMQKHVFPNLKGFDYIWKGDFRHIIMTQRGFPKFISYENFVGYPHINYSRKYNGFLKTREHALGALSSFFPEADTILIVRNHVDLVKSLYNQYIKVGGAISFKDYIDGVSKYSLEKEALIYKNLILDIKKAVSGRLLVVDFRLFRDDLELFEKVFLNFIDCDQKGIFSALLTVRENETLSMRQLRAQLIINSIIKTDFKETGFDIGSRGFKICRSISRRYVSRFFPSGNVFSPDDIEKLKTYFIEDINYIDDLLVEGFCII